MATGAPEKQRFGGRRKVQCRHYSEKGSCLRGLNCSFAHGGDAETPKGQRAKSGLCRFFKQGSCSQGSTCLFSHDEDDLTRSPEGAGVGKQTPQSKHNLKMKVCGFYQKGECRKGVKCNYLHEEAEQSGAQDSPDGSSSPPNGGSHHVPLALEAGVVVRVSGLSKMVELNGQLGVCKCWDSDRSRWMVLLRQDEASVKALKQDNLSVEVELKVGSLVRISGLSSATNLNGELATCQSWVVEKCRWMVTLGSDAAVSKLLKPENLNLIDATPNAKDSAASVAEEQKASFEAVDGMQLAEVVKVCDTNVVLNVNGNTSTVHVSCFKELWAILPRSKDHIKFMPTRSKHITPFLVAVRRSGMDSKDMHELMLAVEAKYHELGSEALIRFHTFCYGYFEYALAHLPVSQAATPSSLDVFLRFGTKLLRRSAATSTIEAKFVLSMLQGRFVAKTLPVAIQRGQLSDIAVHKVMRFALDAVQAFPRHIFLCKDLLVSGTNIRVASLACGEVEMARSLVEPLLAALNLLSDGLAVDEGFSSYASWRQMPLVPSFLSQDLTDIVDLPKVAWLYDSFEDYMDTYFRLLRADCFGSLQSGVKAFVKGKLDPRDLRVYHAAIASVHILRNAKGFVATISCENYFRRGVCFPPRALMQSNLVCLSVGTQPFSEVLWGRIVERPTGRKVQSQPRLEVTVEFLEELNVLQGYDLLSCLLAPKVSVGNMLLADNPVFYLSFGPVLRKLRALTSETLPLGSTLLGRPTDTDSAWKSLPWSSCAKKSLDECIENGERVFDDSQGKALQLMINSKVSCIQGPPGTGKSFIGVEVTRHLLRTPIGLVPPLMSSGPRVASRRRPPWVGEDIDSDGSERSFIDGVDPDVFSIDDYIEEDFSSTCDQKMRVLVLTYKNHALDEFLLDCLKHILPTPTVIRIGGRCEDEELQSRNLGMLARSKKKSHAIGKMLHHKITERTAVAESISEALSNLNQRLVPAALCAEYASSEQLLSLVRGCPLQKNRSHTRHHARLQDDIVNGVRVAADDLCTCFVAWQPPPAAPMKSQQPADAIEAEASDVEAEVEASERKAFEEVVERFGSLKLGECLGTVPIFAPADSATLSRLSYCDDLWALETRDRSQLLGIWLQQEVASYKEHLGPMLRKSDDLAQVIVQLERAHQVSVLREADVVGCTISGASIRSELLSEVNFPVVIVEEAAEILEPQLVAAIPPSCRQLIMIGDHFQLRPKIENHRLGRELNFDRSLMERLLLNQDARYPTVSLTTQNRMRNEFLCMLSPYYPNLLTNMERVARNLPLDIISKAMFFVTTQEHMESESEVGRSVMNHGEANIIIQFVNHILQEGYPEKDVTILAMYDGQVTLLRRLLRENKHEKVSCCTVDRYQGDENQFVLVSLVRSNTNGKIGFVAERNRLIVAASRARSGVYFFGNAALLEEKSSEWRQLIRSLKCVDCFGSVLPLRCPRHVHVSLKLGQCCHHICNQPLGCGHRCRLACHREGAHPKCEEEASVKLRCGHTKACQCWQVEVKDQLHCVQSVSFKHEICGHEATRKCSENSKPCSVTVDVQCTRCMEWGKAPCATKTVNTELYRCQKPCLRDMSCSHPCTLLCFEDCEKNVDDCKLCLEERKRVSLLRMWEVERRSQQIAKDDHFEETLLNEDSHEYAEVNLEVSRYFGPVGVGANVISMRKVHSNSLERQFYRQHQFLSSNTSEKVMFIEAPSGDEAKRWASDGFLNVQVGRKGAPRKASYRDIYKQSPLEATSVRAGRELHLLMCRVQCGRVYELGRKGHRQNWGDKVPEDFDCMFNPETLCYRLTRVALALPTHVLQLWVQPLPAETSFAQPGYWSQDAASSGRARGWKVLPVSSDEKKALTAALDPGGSLGGRDQRTVLNYSKFTYAHAWRLEHPGMWCEYAAARQHICLQQKHGLRIDRVKLRWEYEQLGRNLPANLDVEINEVYLSHGTKPESVLALMSEGLNERFSGGIFGHGTYLAEDVAKNDQYVDYDKSYGCHKELHQILFDETGLKHPADLLYVFFCRVVLGRFLRTEDGETNLDQPGSTIWSIDKKELAKVNDSKQSVFHHSLLAETGGIIRRYREFILFHGTRLYPEYLVAYKRE